MIAPVEKVDTTLTAKQKAKKTYDEIERRKRKKIKENRDKFIDVLGYKVERSRRCNKRSK